MCDSVDIERGLVGETVHFNLLRHRFAVTLDDLLQGLDRGGRDAVRIASNHAAVTHDQCAH